MPPGAGSYCTCHSCILSGDVGENGIRLGKLWTGPAKLAHLKRVQMQQVPSAIAEATAHIASLKRPGIPSQSIFEEPVRDLGIGSHLSTSAVSDVDAIITGVQTLQIHSDVSPLVPAMRNERGMDKRHSKQERSRLTTKAHMVLKNVENRLDICSEKLRNPCLESFQYVEKELPQLAQILNRVNRNVQSIVDRKAQITRQLTLLETLTSDLNQTHYNVPPSTPDESPLRFSTSTYAASLKSSCLSLG